VVSIRRSELDDLRFSIQLLQAAQIQQEEKGVCNLRALAFSEAPHSNSRSTKPVHHLLTLSAQRESGLLLELLTFNQRTQAVLDTLQARVGREESADVLDVHPGQDTRASALAVQPVLRYRTTANARSRSPSPDRRERTDRHARKNVRKDLAIKIPGKTSAPRSSDLPTPTSDPVVRMTPSLSLGLSKTPKSPVSRHTDTTCRKSLH
jgi:hypothetical protein